MASKSVCFWSFIIFFCVHFGSRVQGNGLQQAEKGVYGSVNNTSTLYANATTDIPIWDQPLSASILYDTGGPHEQEFAILRTHPGQYFSAKASMTVHALYNLNHDQLSVAAVWVMNLEDGPPQKSDIISAGWHHIDHAFAGRTSCVHPRLHHDKHTHFFVSWSVVYGDSRKGCYNLRCKGFVLHKNTTYIPGALIKPVSIYNGDQYQITLKITQDRETGNWWLYHGGDKPVGHWPKKLFTSLPDLATNVDFGGAVDFYRGDLGPQMGSGDFPFKGKRKAALLSDIEINDLPFDADDEIFYTHQSLPNWYQIGGDDQRMYFGGPGGFKNPANQG